MPRKGIKDLTTELLADFLDENHLELYKAEFKKEASDWFLRVYVDVSADSEKEYIDTEDCEKVSRFLSEKLDEADPIDKNYYLEVSSPGMDRELLKDTDFEKYKGREVEVKLYKGIDGQKKICGKLGGLSGGIVTVEDEKGRIWELNRRQIAKINLAVVF